MPRLKSNSVFTCDGCSKVAGWTASTGWKCSVYENPCMVTSIHAYGQCPFNLPNVKSKKQRVRVGQQKQKVSKNA